MVEDYLMYNLYGWKGRKKSSKYMENLKELNILVFDSCSYVALAFSPVV